LLGTVSLVDKCEASTISVSVGNSANLCSILHVTYKVKINLVTLYPEAANVKIYSVSMFPARIKLPLLSKYVVILLLCSLTINFVKIKKYNPTDSKGKMHPCIGTEALYRH